jgi:hypothetical protein
MATHPADAVTSVEIFALFTDDLDGRADGIKCQAEPCGFFIIFYQGTCGEAGSAQPG